MKVNDIVELSDQSPHTLRNWFNKGVVHDKSYLILCLIIAYKWREHNLVKKQHLVPDFTERRTLINYLKPHRLTPKDLTDISHQSSQTLLNWLNSSDKYLMIDVLIDAVKWYRFACDKGLIRRNSFYEWAFAAMQPISQNQEMTKFALTDFVNTTTRKKNRRKPEETKRWKDGQVLE